MDSKGPEKICLTMFHILFRTINRLNPTSYGRHFVSKLATRLNAIPKDGVYRLEPGLIMDLHMNDFIEHSLYFDSFEFLCRRIILSFLKSDSVFIDIGANIGYYSLLANAKGHKVRVISFEPNPDTVKKLKRNIHLNSDHRIELFDIALSDNVGEVMLYCPKNETHGHASMRNHGWRDPDTYRISTRRLDDVLPEDIEHIDLIKIDVEGSELFVFKGGEETVKKFKPAIIMELNEEAATTFGYDILDVVKLLLSYNPSYKLKFIAPHEISETTLNQLIAQKKRNGNLLLF